MIQPAVIGGCFWLLAWCVILCYILGLNKRPKQTQETEPLTREKLVANATKTVSYLHPSQCFNICLGILV